MSSFTIAFYVSYLTIFPRKSAPDLTKLERKDWSKIFLRFCYQPPFFILMPRFKSLVPNNYSHAIPLSFSSTFWQSLKNVVSDIFLISFYKLFSCTRIIPREAKLLMSRHEPFAGSFCWIVRLYCSFKRKTDTEKLLEGWGLNSCVGIKK